MRPVSQFIAELKPVYNARQCAEIIDWSERQGFSPWPGDSDEVILGRCEADDRLLFDLWISLAGAIEVAIRRRPIRFAGPVVIDRFDAGQRLLPTRGGVIESERESEGVLVVVIFLGEVYAGGEIVCYPADGPRSFAARAGAGVVFPRFLTSEELPVRAGRKYVLRTAVVVDEV